MPLRVLILCLVELVKLRPIPELRFTPIQTQILPSDVVMLLSAVERNLISCPVISLHDTLSNYTPPLVCPLLFPEQSEPFEKTLSSHL